jgi:hypothetical protein
VSVLAADRTISRMRQPPWNTISFRCWMYHTPQCQYFIFISSNNISSLYALINLRNSTEMIVICTLCYIAFSIPGRLTQICYVISSLSTTQRNLIMCYYKYTLN